MVKVKIFKNVGLGCYTFSVNEVLVDIMLKSAPKPDLVLELDLVVFSRKLTKDKTQSWKYVFYYG